MPTIENYATVKAEIEAALARHLDLDATKLAKAIGRDGGYIRDFLNGKKRSLGAVEIAAIEARLGINLAPKLSPAPPAPRPRQNDEVELASDVPRFEDLGGRRDVPVYGISVGGDDGDFSLNGETVEYVNHPRALLGRKIFAVRVMGSSMEPRFEEGDLLYVEQNREPAIGEDGIFEMKPTDEWEAGRSFIKRLVSKGMGIVTVRQFNPAKEIPYPRNDIKRMYRVIPRNELMGV